MAHAHAHAHAQPDGVNDVAEQGGRYGPMFPKLEVTCNLKKLASPINDMWRKPQNNTSRHEQLDIRHCLLFSFPDFGFRWLLVLWHKHLCFSFFFKEIFLCRFIVLYCISLSPFFFLLVMEDEDEDDRNCR